MMNTIVAPPTIWSLRVRRFRSKLNAEVPDGAGPMEPPNGAGPPEGLYPPGAPEGLYPPGVPDGLYPADAPGPPDVPGAPTRTLDPWLLLSDVPHLGHVADPSATLLPHCEQNMISASRIGRSPAPCRLPIRCPSFAPVAPLYRVSEHRHALQRYWYFHKLQRLARIFWIGESLVFALGPALGRKAQHRAVLDRLVLKVVAGAPSRP